MWQGALGIASLLLVVAGVAKLADPYGTLEALGSLGLRISPLVVRAGAAAEAVVGAAALVLGGSLAAALVAASYLAFAAFVAAGRRSPAASSCGCFGRHRARPSRRHALVNLAFAVGAATAAATGPASLGMLALRSPGWAALDASIIGTGALLGVIALAGPDATAIGGSS